MLRRFLFPTTLVLLLAGCADYANRTYRYAEEVPVKPFVFKLGRTEYTLHDQNVEMKLFLEVSNHSTDRNKLSRQRFVLRVGTDREVTRDTTLLESLGVDTTGFSPGEQAVITLPFLLSRKDLLQKLTLIVDRQENKAGRTRLTLIEVKNGSAPIPLPALGETRTVRSARWN